MQILDSLGLNAPFGAWCFLTKLKRIPEYTLEVLMHLLVLRAF